MGFLIGLLKFILGLATGAAIGVAIAILLAPQSGEELRIKIDRRIEEGKQARAEAEAATRLAMEQEFRRMVNDESALRSAPTNGTASTSARQP
jgi:gas vesicle protein